jgi:hypothetical protein
MIAAQTASAMPGACRATAARLRPRPLAAPPGRVARRRAGPVTDARIDVFEAWFGDIFGEPFGPGG